MDGSRSSSNKTFFPPPSTPTVEPKGKGAPLRAKSAATVTPKEPRASRESGVSSRGLLERGKRSVTALLSGKPKATSRQEDLTQRLLMPDYQASHSSIGHESLVEGSYIPPESGRTTPPVTASTGDTKGTDGSGEEPYFMLGGEEEPDDPPRLPLEPGTATSTTASTLSTTTSTTTHADWTQLWKPPTFSDTYYLDQYDSDSTAPRNTAPKDDSEFRKWAKQIELQLQGRHTVINGQEVIVLSVGDGQIELDCSPKAFEQLEKSGARPISVSTHERLRILQERGTGGRADFVRCRLDLSRIKFQNRKSRGLGDSEAYQREQSAQRSKKLPPAGSTPATTASPLDTKSPSRAVASSTSSTFESQRASWKTFEGMKKGDRIAVIVKEDQMQILEFQKDVQSAPLVPVPALPYKLVFDSMNISSKNRKYEKSIGPDDYLLMPGALFTTPNPRLFAIFPEFPLALGDFNKYPSEVTSMLLSQRE